ncbi:hypothetical protein F7725_023269, partial [Dissostichus mawsoni]
MFTGMRVESRGVSGGLDAAAVRQQRRLKQAIQFLHRDSADLLPLDGLKKLGHPHRGMNNEGISLSCTHINSHEDEEEEADDFVYVPCKCLGQEVKVLIDTGCKLNLMSSRTVERLCLKDLVEENKMEVDGFPFQRKLCIDGHIRELSLTLGKLRVMCPFFIL